VCALSAGGHDSKGQGPCEGPDEDFLYQKQLSTDWDKVGRWDWA